MCSSQFIYTREAALFLLRCACVLFVGLSRLPFQADQTFKRMLTELLYPMYKYNAYSLSSQPFLSCLLSGFGQELVWAAFTDSSNWVGLNARHISFVSENVPNFRGATVSGFVR